MSLYSLTPLRDVTLGDAHIAGLGLVTVLANCPRSTAEQRCQSLRRGFTPVQRILVFASALALQSNRSRVFASLSAAEVGRPRLCRQKAPLARRRAEAAAGAVDYDSKVLDLCTRDAAAAEMLMCSMRDAGIQPQMETYNAFIQALCRKDRCKQTLQWLKYMLEAGHVPSAISFQKAIQSFARHGKASLVEEAYEGMSQAGVIPGIETFTALISLEARAGNLKAAERWFARLRDSGLSPNLITYNAVINAAAQKGDAPSAEAWLARLRAEGVEADEATWASLINAYATARDAAGAERAFSRAQAALVGLGGRGAGLSCSPVLYRTVAKAFAKSRDVAGTERWILEMSDRGLEPGLEGYSTILRACGAEGQLQRTEYWFLVMAQRGIIPDKKTVSSVLVGLADGGRAQEAASWLGEMQRRGFPPDADDFAHALRACGRASPPQSTLAQDLLREMKARNVKADQEVLKSLKLAVPSRRVEDLLKDFGLESGGGDRKDVRKGRRR